MVDCAEPPSPNMQAYWRLLPHISFVCKYRPTLSLDTAARAAMNWKLTLTLDPASFRTEGNFLRAAILTD